MNTDRETTAPTAPLPCKICGGVPSHFQHDPSRATTQYHKYEPDWPVAPVASPSTPECKLPPDGWSCSRGAGHVGPCAARPVVPEGVELVMLHAIIEAHTTLCGVDGCACDYCGRWADLRDALPEFAWETMQRNAVAASPATPTPEPEDEIVFTGPPSGTTNYVPASALASSQQEIADLRAALLAVFNRWGFMEHDADCKVGQSGVELDCNCRRLALGATLRFLTSEPR